MKRGTAKLAGRASAKGRRWHFGAAGLAGTVVTLLVIVPRIVLGAPDLLPESLRVLTAPFRSAGTTAPAPVVLSALAAPACQPGDRPYTGLQGQVPLADRLDGRAARGYRCNLALIGSYVEPGRVNIGHAVTGAWATLDSYHNCAYFGDASAGLLGPSFPVAPAGGTVVLDVSDPAHPVQTDYLTAAAAKAPWEALRVNASRGLLVEDRNASPAFAVYDLSVDCRHPRMLYNGAMPHARGHEGYFAPDGRTFYVTDGSTNHLAAIDLTDPTRPRELEDWSFAGAAGFHGGSTSLDGNTGYQCEYTSPGSVRVLDLSGVQNRSSFTRPATLSQIPLPNNEFCQATYPVTYDNHQYLIQYGERSQIRCPNTASDHSQAGGDANFDYPRIIDIANPAHPRVVADLALQVDLPQNCSKIEGDLSPRSVAFATIAGGGGAVFGYDDHHCSPDRLINPTVLACGQFLAGLMVYDIRNPLKPRELAYDNMGTVGAADQTVDDAISRPVVRADRGLVYWTTEWSGFHVARFENGVYPFSGAQCGAADDYFFQQYNPPGDGGSGCSADGPPPVPMRQ